MLNLFQLNPDALMHGRSGFSLTRFPIHVVERTGLRALLEKQSALSVTEPTRRCTGLNPALIDDDAEAGART